MRMTAFFTGPNDRTSKSPIGAIGQMTPTESFLPQGVTMFQFNEDRRRQIRLHSTTLTDPQLMVLICFVAVLCARKGLARIAITDDILDTAEAMALESAPAEAESRIKRQYRLIR